MPSYNRSFNFDSDKQKGLKGLLSINIRELLVYRYAWFNFVDTALSARYRRSVLGFFWTLLNPLFTMTIISLVFSTLFKHSFADYSLYLFSGQMPWIFISNSVVLGASSIILGEGYLKKVYVPKLIFPLTTVGVEFINFLFSFVGLSVLALILGAPPHWTWLLMPFALLLTAFFVLGLIMIVSCITVYFRDLSHILQIFFLGLFYLTPIVYKQGLMGDELLFIIKINPFFYFIDLFHSIIYNGVLPSLQTFLICIGLTTTSLPLGYLVFGIFDKDLIYRL